MTVNPKRALYIKLGNHGEWESDCILKDQTLRLGYNEADHDACLRGDWGRVRKIYEEADSNPGVITRHVDQIKEFYTAGDDVLWVTFYANKLWYCFSRPEVTRLDDGTKIRPVTGAWSSYDNDQNPLLMSQLSGRILKTQRYQGTICSVNEFEYIIHRINAEPSEEVEYAKKAFSDLVAGLKEIIKNLYHKDFEILVDLIFRQAGLQRVSTLGDTMKIIDLDLISPLTKERFAVQVKSRANRKSFEDYKHQFSGLDDYSRFFFVVHSPSKDLDKSLKSEKIELLFPHDIAELAVRYGLAEWIISKAKW